ncbi:MAG: 50S ribosomal protein L3 [Simkaniaceae bacterium]|nr:50S ribosomal protein L3 [Candidatus Sacchlamyda saccharinae]
MSLQLIGKKKGMTRIFDEKGESVVCTVIEAEPNVVIQVKNQEKDGYVSMQLGGVKVPSSKVKNVTKPLKGHFAKAKVEPRRHLKESQVAEGEMLAVGEEVGVSHFEKIAFVDVIGVTKGKGFQGVIKRHGFAGGPAAHGSGFHRTAGSTGMCSNPGRTLPGLKMAGHMGNVRMTVEGLKVVRIDQEKNIILVKGAVPGSREGLVYIRKSTKR